MQVYMHLTGLIRALYLAVCKDTDALYTERVRVDHDEAERLLARAGRIIFAARPPARISDDPDRFQCRLCPHRDGCHGDGLPERTCRSCLHVTPTEDGGWHCARFDQRLSADEQRAGFLAPVPSRADPGRAVRRRPRGRLGRLPQVGRHRLAGRCGMTLELRPHQRAAIEAIYGYFAAETGHPLIMIPTAGGKSLVMAAFIQEVLAQWPDERIIILTHVRELISQNFAELIRLWPGAPAGIYSAGLNRRDTQAQILFAGIQSVHRKAYAIQRADLVLVDEAHLIPRRANTTYRRFLDDLTRINPQLKIIGLTATPYRLDSGMLHTGPDALFDDIAFEVSVRELIDRGYLAPLISKQTTTQIDVAGVGTRGGEFIAGQLEAAVDQDPITQAALDEIAAYTAGTGVPGSCSAPASITRGTCAMR
jgi:hypothetical protein